VPEQERGGGREGEREKRKREKAATAAIHLSIHFFYTVMLNLVNFYHILLLFNNTWMQQQTADKRPQVQIKKTTQQ
jgi:hypothetical protein